MENLLTFFSSFPFRYMEIQYDFSGRRDIVRFIKEVQAQGLYACIRIGPFIESEWNYG